MSAQNRSFSLGKHLLLISLGLADLALVIRYFIHGRNVALFNPQGQIARQQHSLMMFILGVLLAVAIPSLGMLFFIAWKYRETNHKLAHGPGAKHSKTFVGSIWLFPTLVMLLLASVMIPMTRKLAPRKALSDAKPLTIQVISLRWKWLFIYPQQQVASLNFVQLPMDTPVTFEMTADETPMSSFWIPNLEGQLYTMTSHLNRLNMMASKPGDYPGSSAEINGAGFAGMKFTARVSSKEGFDSWVKSVKQSPNQLDGSAYKDLLKPSQYNPSEFYSDYTPNLYADVIAKYEGPGGHIH